MHYSKDKSTYILSFEQGEEVIATITEFCKKEDIKNAHFSGIGAVRDLSCGYYALEEKKYYFTSYEELVEVASLTGNVMLKEGAPFVHAHGVFTNTRNEAFGGHIQEMQVGVALEIILTVFDDELERLHNEKTGLYHISCEARF